MTEGNPISTPSSIVERAKAIILTPKQEWAKIDAEPASIGGIFTGYVVILAAIGPVAGFIGGQVFGHGMMGFSWRPTLLGGLSMAIVSYVLSLVSVFLLAFIDALAPSFGGQKDKLKAFKVAAYAATASWLAGVFSLIPSLSMLGILGLYSLYLLYTGLPILMKAPEEKATGYTVVTVIAAILLSLVAAALTAPVGGLFMGSAMRSGADDVAGEVTVPGVGKVDMGKLDQASQQMEQAAKRMEAAVKGESGAAISPATLEAMLPERIGGYSRTEIESGGMSAGAQASATYEAGDRSFRVKVTDMAAVGALTGLGAALNVQSNKQTATGYERTQTINGRMVNEEWDNSSKDGKFGTTVANRFMVEAEGSANSIDELKAAVAAVGPDKLEALAK